MTKQEAIAFAMSTGKPITHQYFADDEFIRYENGKLIDELDICLPEHEFWDARTGGFWENGWKEYVMSPADEVEELIAKKRALEPELEKAAQAIYDARAYWKSIDAKIKFIEDQISSKISLDMSKFVGQYVKIKSEAVCIQITYDYWYIEEMRPSGKKNGFIVIGYLIDGHKPESGVEHISREYIFDKHTQISVISKDVFKSEFDKRINAAKKVLDM